MRTAAEVQRRTGHPRSPGGQGEGIPFVGWLGLLRTLDELMASADDAAPQDADQ
jgi:hypothetical protein